MVLERFEIIYFLGKQSLKKFLNNFLVSDNSLINMRNSYFIVFVAGFIIFV